MSRTTPATALLSQAASRYGQALTSHYTQAWLNRFLKHRRNCSAYRVRADEEMRRDGDITGSAAADCGHVRPNRRGPDVGSLP